MSRPRLLDLFCGAGGAAMGYHRAGFDVVGVDIAPQPHYPFEFYQEDARTLGDFIVGADLLRYADAIHASPPCQFYAKLSGYDHWRSIPPTRDLVEKTGLPYVIENIDDARWDMREPILLCGSMFDLKVQRHRLFETSLPVFLQQPCSHGQQDEIRAYYGGGGKQVQKAGRKPLLRGDVETSGRDMGIDWMTWSELREAVPPAYTEFIGEQLMREVVA